MCKKIIIFILLTGFCAIGFSEEIKLKIIEKKGTVDIKFRDQNWHEPELNNIISYGTEIFTGFHSQLSIEVGTDSYITINQLSHVIIENVIAKKEEAKINLFLKSGYLVILSKTKKDYKKKIFVTLDKGTVEFNNSGGEIYLIKDKGVIIKAFKGRVKIGSKLSKIHFIRRGEVCGILPEGKLLENDYYLRRKLNAKPNHIINPQDIIGYYELMFQPYTSETGISDYYDAYHP